LFATQFQKKGEEMFLTFFVYIALAISTAFLLCGIFMLFRVPGGTVGSFGVATLSILPGVVGLLISGASWLALGWYPESIAIAWLAGGASIAVLLGFIFLTMLFLQG